MASEDMNGSLAGSDSGIMESTVEVEGEPGQEGGTLSSYAPIEGYGTIDKTSLLSEQQGGKEEEVCSPCWNKLFHGRFMVETKKNLSIAWGLILTSYSTTLMPPICTMFAGHLGETELDAVSLANSIIVMFGTTVILGLATACDTFFTQAIGRGNLKSVGILLQRSILILFTLLILVCALFVYVGPLLVLIGEPPEISRLAGQYVMIYIPGLYANCAFVICTKYLACQHKVLPNAIIGGAGLLINAIFQYFLLYYWRLGVQGSAIAQDIGCVSLILLMILYLYFSKIYKATWYGWNWAILLDWWIFMRIGFHGLIMLCLEFWVWEIIILLSGLLGARDLAVQTVFFMIEALFLSIGLGFGDAAAVRVGVELGSGRPGYAKVASRVGLILIACVSLVISTFIGTLRYQLPKMFTNSPEVVAMTAALLPFAVYYTPLLNIVLNAEGVLRGAGKQAVGAAIILVAYYFVAVPIGVPLMFLTPLGNAGSWWGMCIGITLSCVCFLIYLEVLMDWDKEAQLAMERGAEERGLYKMGSKEMLGTNLEESIGTVEDSEPPSMTSTTSEADYSGCLNSTSSNSDMVTRSLITRRVLTILAFLLIFLIAIICRFFV